MGEEKLDNTVYTIRGLFDLADMARAKHDTATATWARDHARDLLSTRSRPPGGTESASQYADSLDDPGDKQVFQKHWIGVTPMEAELTRGGKAHPGLASREHGTTALIGREDPCYSGTRPYNPGLFHTGCGGGPEGKGERSIFGLNTAIQSVGEGNYGRLEEQKRYTDAEVEPMFGEPYTGGDVVHHTPGTPDEQPGSSPEIFPSPDFDAAGPRDANVERCTRCRSMVVQAWNQYGTMWPVVHQQLGVRPDLGRGRLTIVPQLPSKAPIAGADIRLGDGRLDLVARLAARRPVHDDGRRPARAGDAPANRPHAAARRHRRRRGAGRPARGLQGPRDEPRRRGHRPGRRRPARGGGQGGLSPSQPFSSAHRAPTVQAWTRLERGTGSTTPRRETP